MKALFHVAVLGAVILFSSYKPMEPKNFHKVNDDIYRSAQISSSDVNYLKLVNMASVLNLRKNVSNSKKLKGSGIAEIRIPMHTRRINTSEMRQALKELHEAPKPCLVHCRRGIDRTGAVIACYRMVYERWSREEAIAEFRSEEFGYSERLFPEVLEFLKTVDIASLK